MNEILLEFLDELMDRFGNDGCNDYRLENTPENRELVSKAEYSSYGEETELCTRGKYIYTSNIALLEYLKKELQKGNLTFQQKQV